MNEKFHTSSKEETFLQGKRLGEKLRENSILALRGDLGAGKTLFVKGIAESLSISPLLITSPTFTYLHSFDAKIPLHHFDLYRLKEGNDFLSLGFEEYLTGGISCIEWPEKILHLLPKPYFLIDILYNGPNERSIHMEQIT